MKRFLFSMLAILIMVASAPVKKGYEVGDVAADFKLKNVDGKMVSLADWKDAKGFIVIFDCNTCPYSKAYNERIIALNSKYASLGYPLIAINPNNTPGDTFEDNVSYAKKKGYSFPYLIDETQQVSMTFGATNTPHVYILKRFGKDLIVEYIGTIDDSPRDAASVNNRYVEDAVDALIAGRSIPASKAKTKAIGCSIKYKNS